MADFLDLVGLFAILAAVLAPITWAWVYDRYTKALYQHDLWKSWLAALRAETEHGLEEVKLMESSFEKMEEAKTVAIMTNRFNEDLFQVARSVIISHPRSPHIFPKLTRAYRDTTHTNKMLDRMESLALQSVDDLKEKKVPVILSNLVEACKAALSNTKNTLESLVQDLLNEENLLPSIRPTLYECCVHPRLPY